ncbi:amino acid ABC transporter permease [Microbacterium sp. cx-59]|uniref:amino acid ABC transporter permease n=1 Tax=Microbacterium sp. cx-59 TaxID=2891207 RepID=UPI001E40D4C9|nr:amino acid ABC transporter permease [Microbacterium sp. cx-59]MCC4908898.1 amino acid ABC transporter permease [Microbacterium sp. cx-59]
MEIFSDWPDNFLLFLPGLGVTLALTFWSLAFGLPLGVLLALSSLSKRAVVRTATMAIVEFGRGVPALVLLYLIYFGLPQVDIVLPAFAAAVVGLGFSTGAYTSEIVRGGIRSISSTQGEAAFALAMTPRQAMARVILPQALRHVIPPLVGFSVLLYQATSLAYAISVPELLSKAYSVASITFAFASCFLLAGVMYAVLSITVSVLVNGRAAKRA